MPLSSIEAAGAALVVGVGNAAVALGVIGVERATVLETAIVGAISAVFLLANSIIHHGATVAAGKDVSHP
jgi:hypothetical protein